MKELEPYPSYQSTSMDWASRLPSGWKSTSLARVASIFAGGTPDRTNAEFWTDGSVPWLNSGSVNDGTITSPSELITPAAATGSSTRWAHAGSVLIALAGQGKTKGMAARLEMSSTFNQSMAAIVPRANLLEYRFLQYWLRTNYQTIRNMAGGDLRDGLNLQHIGAIQAPLPPLREQTSIASFLDGETAEIDAFIADQEELIGLLAERRAATISHAVTKGLDPNVPMKDSGVEWMGGEVPANWTVTRVKHLTHILPGYAFASDDFSESETSTRLLRGINVGVGEVDWGATVGWDKGVDQKLAVYVLEEGDVVVGLDRPIILAGVRVARIRNRDLPSLLLQRVARLRAIPGQSMRFIEYGLSSEMFADYLAPLFTGVSVPHISPQQVGDFTIALPDALMQRLIVEKLDRELAELDAAIADAREAITLSRERRAALISAAVTGKIDVRERGAVA